MEINEKIPGWKSISHLTTMAEIVQKLPLNARIAEVGSGLGRLTWVLSKNAPDGSIVYAIDTWEHLKLDKHNSEFCINCDENTIITKEEFLRHIDDCDNIVSIQKAFPFKWEHDKVDMIFIDAEEEYEIQISYLEQAFKMIKPNGIICGEDYNEQQFPGLVQAVNEMSKIHNKEIQFPKYTWLWRYI